MRIDPARLAFDANGTPYSPAYEDVYHSADSGPGQARHVFVGGNDLPHAWRGARLFTILETGFGFGLNFLATWREWRDDPGRCERLHFVSIEKHPFTRVALATLHARYGEFAALCAQLREAWPPLVPGLHRLHFDDGRLTLTLALGDLEDVLPRLALDADAIYLDGFSPQRNPAMWSARVMKALSRLSHPGTTAATWSTASSVRHALEAAGFALEKRPGFGHKREMLHARFAPRWPVRGRAEADPAAATRQAIVIGAGIAGTAVTERLAARGWNVTRIDRNPPRPGAFAAVFHPHVSRDDCILSRVARNGFLYALARWRALERAGAGLEWARSGLLQLSGNAAHEQWPDETVAALGYPADYAQYLDRARAEALAGARLASGGWWFPDGGWMRLVGRVKPAGETHPADVAGIERRGDLWHALDADGASVAAAPVLVLANAHDATRLVSFAQALKRVRGQVTCVPAECVGAPRCVVTGAGYVVPAVDGVVTVGSTYDPDDDPQLHSRGHEANLARLAHMLPDALHRPLDAAHLDGAVGFRAVAPDRLPLVGAVPDVEEIRRRASGLAGAHLPDLPRLAGLYCVTGFASRGLIWSALAGEIVASTLEGEPPPLETDLADALDPARFVLRRLRGR